jgi:hypothetical protein|uniref:Uncharacterized protein n=2 Tax=Picea TaxID=3328 RepID=A0A124GN09_PICGL|nr:hypothetical protein ABT39_MTgene5532 [Picea glauca]QHR91601.1 hypothetical protein Q903MT_gene5636 [Picea sitchensis]
MHLEDPKHQGKGMAPVYGYRYEVGAYSICGICSIHPLLYYVGGAFTRSTRTIGGASTELKGRRRKEPYYLCADSPLQDSTLSWHFTYAREKPGNKATKN